MLYCIVKTLWGCEGLDDPNQWESLLRRVVDDGFDAVEVPALPFLLDNATQWKSELAKHNLQFIMQLHTCGYRARVQDGTAALLNDQGFVPSCSVTEHIASFRSQLQAAHRLGAIRVNCHSGHDSWSIRECKEYFQAVLQIATTEAPGLPVSHETHRRRCLWNPWQARDLIKEFPDLQITADLSHWVCVGERVFSSQTDREFRFSPEWLEAPPCHPT